MKNSMKNGVLDQTTDSGKDILTTELICASEWDLLLYMMEAPGRQQTQTRSL